MNEEQTAGSQPVPQQKHDPTKDPKKDTQAKVRRRRKRSKCKGCGGRRISK